MKPNFTRKQILKAIERAQSAEPYSPEIWNNLTSDIFDSKNQLDQKRVTATMAKITLDKYFKSHPEDSIENYIEDI